MSRSAPGRPNEPYIPATYRKDVEIPFAPDGNAPLISGFVEEVKGTTSTFKDLRCARKTIIIDPEADSVLQTSLKRKLVQEAKILWLARHQHVVQLVHTYFEQTDKRPTRFAVIMDRADSSLQIYLELGERPARGWFGCLMSVVQHIHALGIRHRDIKPSNILVKQDKILLADFGISQMGLGNTMPTTYEGRKVSRTKEYCAPEVERGSTRGRSADIFSLGAVFLEILVALNDLKYSAQLDAVLKPSFESTASYAQNINAIHQWLKDKFQPLGWQEGILSTCQEMLHPVRGARPTARKIVQIWSSRPVSDRYMFCDCTGGPAPSQTEILIEACQRGSEQEVKNLLDKGPESGISEAIHHAAARGSIHIVQALLDAGAQVDSRNPVGQTALQCAARNGSLGVVRQLLENQAEVNAKDENEQTALHGAAGQGYEEITTVLLDANADIYAEDLDGDTPSHFAARRRHTAVLALLQNHASSAS